ncbi:MAG TPA: bifunctional 5,10-methylenetetrahydrofolate dehydrogenase/5,10-methenyltetrahydrofolate cyclohydrolase [Patescibacteria group bacterium]|jgi:methylenetetrahydrofolate dehydrogenase (NADP+)/methenyltetrahydrofolate cyclohydrolase|nr:bifunctional 5,10-methylenetetrahydrofolate dehydrogenase/5,10-methenyltetrahydrofolate cyclohydrolase [Patescibacteria group bacterium]
MRSLNGTDLSDFIKQRQANQVLALRQAHNITPRLAIILCNDQLASSKYIEMKQEYAEDIAAEVIVEHSTSKKVVAVIEKHNADPATHGIIVQLPLDDPSLTDDVLAAVSSKKDVDGLNSNEFFDPATPTAILWLLAGYNVELRGKKVVVIGQGKLVGAPLTRMLQASGISVTKAGRGDDLAAICNDAEVIITGTGQPGLLTSDLIPKNAVVVDAGTASEGNKLVGDVDPTVLDTRSDLTITPRFGGVGPLTICALFENVIRAANPTKA